MKIEHIAIWTRDIERLAEFYTKHFGVVAGPLYHNAQKGFSSRFLSFKSGARLELMSLPTLPESAVAPSTGLAHFAISAGSEVDVDSLAVRIKLAGGIILDGPRRTGDGYYECCVADPDGNRVEITV